METGTLKVHTENIFPIIKKFLYSDHEIFLRELVSNAVDACQKVKTLANAGEINHDGKDLKVEILLDKTAGTLTIRDNGIGMTAAEVDKYINQIAFSGAEEFVDKYKDAQIIGHFGLGFYSAFMVAKRVEIFTLSQRSGSVPVYWSCDGSPDFTMKDGEKTEAGTEIVLHMGDDALEFLEEQRIRGILDKYCKFMPVPIVFGEKSTWIDDPSGKTDKDGQPEQIEVKSPDTINNTDPLWLRKPADLKDEDYKSFYRELYPTSFDEPLFHIHINVDFPFNLTGILYFPKLKNNFEVQRNKIALYSNQVFITDEVKNILPDFLTLLHGVVDSPDIPLNVSRSYLQEDANVKKISAHISKKVADKLQQMFSSDRPDFESKWNDIGVFIQYGMLTDEKFFERAEKFALYTSTTGQAHTWEELKDKIAEAHKDKKGDVIYLYTTDPEAQHTSVESATALGYTVLKMEGPLAPHLLSHLEMKHRGIQFKRVDADVPDRLIPKTDELPLALNEDQQKEWKTKIESLVDSGKFSVNFASGSPNDAPLAITQNEFMRRMKEQSAMGGGGFYGSLPDSYNLVVNGNHPIFSGSRDDNRVKQASDLALLSAGLLKGEALTAFLQRSYSMLGAQ
ncbi:MAG: molecular chaperone HtpG [Flavobacteriales bacterium]|nr:molecular chaperone HtpG [Flavobacteriales bacterium]